MLPEYLNIEKRYYYTKLNDSEKRLYEFMVDCLMNNQMKFIYKYEFDDIDLNSNVLPVFTASLLESIIMTKVWTYMLLDFPEFYFVHEFEFYQDGNIVYMGSKKPYYEVCEINEINKKLEGILLNFESLTDEYEIVYAVNDYICKNYEYDNVTKDYYINPNNSDSFDISIWKRHREKFTVAGLVKYGIGVCSALSGLAQFILQRKGIKAVNVFGNKENENFGHKWLLVNLDDEYYNLDVTFNNTLSNDPSLPQNMFLNNNYDLSKYIYLPSEEDECKLLKNSKALKFNYYVMNDLYFDRIDLLLEKIYSFIINSDKYKVNYLYFSIDSNLNKTVNIRNIISENLESINIKFETFEIVSKYNYYTMITKLT